MFGKATTQELIESLLPGRPGSLKARPDGTMIDGHYRITVLMGRGIDVESFTREILAKDSGEEA